MKGNPTSTNSIASIYAWTRGLAFRGKLDSNDRLVRFAHDLEQCCIDSVDRDGVMTKDLALAIHGKQMTQEHYVTTSVPSFVGVSRRWLMSDEREGFLDHVREKLINKVKAYAKL